MAFLRVKFKGSEISLQCVEKNKKSYGYYEANEWLCGLFKVQHFYRATKI